MKIFGREPTAWVSLIEGIIALMVVFGLGLDRQHAALVIAVVNAIAGFYVAWVTHDTMLGVITGLAKAILALGVGYGLHITAEQMAGIFAFIPIAVGAWHRGQTFPVAFPPTPVPGALPTSNVGTV